MAGGQSPEAWQAMREVHLPLTLKVIRSGLKALEHGLDGQDEGERVLLLTVGLSVEQLALSMAAHAGAGCRRFVPLAPAGIWDQVRPEVLECLELLGEDSAGLRIEEGLAVSGNEPASTFRAVVRWARAHPGLRIAIDCTGGQKPMVSGAGDAASFLGAPVYYLDFEQYDALRRRPLPHTCRYRRLALPDQVLSLTQRRATLEAFTSRRFDVAAARAAQVLEAAEACEHLDEADVAAARKASLLAERSRQWMELRYDHPLLQDHPLHDLLGSSRSRQLGPRAIVEGLREQPAGEQLRSYVVDEMWRLEVLVGLGAGREALVGLVGLIELVVDSMMFLPWFRGVTIDSVLVRRWSHLAGPEPPLPRAPDLGWIGASLPPGHLPPGCQQRKIDLMRKGATRLDIRVATDDQGRPRLDLPPPGRDDARLEAEVRVTLAQPPLVLTGSKGARDRHWSRCWGSYPQGDWVLQRHACAHLRAPLFDTGPLGQALAVAPRFIELLLRLDQSDTVDLEGAGTDEWITWWHDRRWSRRARLPWGADGDTCLARWLDVPLPAVAMPEQPSGPSCPGS